MTVSYAPDCHDVMFPQEHFSLDPYQAPERPAGIVILRAVVIEEHAAGCLTCRSFRQVGISR